MTRHIPHIVMAIFGVFVILIIPSQIPGTTEGFWGPRTIPYIMGIAIVVLSIFSLFQKDVEKNIEKSKEDDEDVKLKKNYLRVAAMFATILIWILLVSYLGFIITTTIVIGLAMFIAGARNKLLIIIIPLLFSLFVYYVFVSLLQVNLPEILF